MQVWDRNAPLPMESDRIVDWDEARETVISAYGAFDAYGRPGPVF